MYVCVDKFSESNLELNLLTIGLPYGLQVPKGVRSFSWKICHP